MIYIAFTIFFLAFSARYNWWRKTESSSKARVLMYHSISTHHKGERFNKWKVLPKDFEKQMKWFYKNDWTSFSISELCRLKKIPNKSFAITFDDGFEDNFINAYPILKKYNFKATIYLVANQNTNHWETKNTKYLSKMLNENQIKQMQESGLIEFGSHTLNHKNLSTITDDEELKKEIFESKAQIEKLTNKECLSFAYPYGKFNDKIKDYVKNANYSNAVVVKRGLFTENDDVLEIKRIGILGTESFFDFWLKIKKIRNKL